MSWQELPCREFCNARPRGCEPGRCANPYKRDDPRFWLGRGSEDVAGKSFGWAKNMQAEAIRAHLLARGVNDGFEHFRRASRLVMRLERDYHRRKPAIGARRLIARPRRPEFTREELEHLVELFAGANDPVSRSIADKAAALLGLG